MYPAHGSTPRLRIVSFVCDDNIKYYFVRLIENRLVSFCRMIDNATYKRRTSDIGLVNRVVEAKKYCVLFVLFTILANNK